jgi:hypothetical protein
MGKLIIDNTPQPFTKSTCKCSLCQEMNDPYYFEAKNNVQSRLLEAVKRIEAREKSLPIDIPKPPPYEENNKSSGFWYK